MLDRRSFLRIREGAFCYLLAGEQVAAIEPRADDSFDPVVGGGSPYAAWYLAGRERIPIIRLGALLRTPVREWGYAVLLSGTNQQIGLAVEQVDLIPDAERPTVRPFDPPGCTLPGGSPIAGVCADAKQLLLDGQRLERCLLGLQGD